MCVCVCLVYFLSPAILVGKMRFKTPFSRYGGTQSSDNPISYEQVPWDLGNRDVVPWISKPYDVLSVSNSRNC